MANNKDELNTLSHTKWNCRYHVVFAPKYRRKVFYDARRLVIIKIFSVYFCCLYFRSKFY